MIAELLVKAFYLYLLIGLVFACWFTFSLVNKLDNGMKTASWRTRLLLIPGSAALWPVLLRKLRRSKKDSEIS